VWHQFTVKVKRRDEVRAAMNAAGITTMVYYPAPLHHMPIYKEEYGRQSFPVSEELCRVVLSLPIYPHLDEQGTARVAATLLETVKSTA
jgi:dTDP-4-amino-4,6-dideoxygalactose transaminase